MLPHGLRMGGGFESSGRVSGRDVESGARMLGGVRMGGCPRICLGRAPWGPGNQGTCPPPALGMERGAHLGRTPFSKCVPSCTSSAFSVLELSHQQELISSVLYSIFCQSSAAKGQNPGTIYWLCELSNGPVGALSQWHPTSSPSFSLSPHPVCSIPTNACLGHTRTRPLTYCHQPFLLQP